MVSYFITDIFMDPKRDLIKLVRKPAAHTEHQRTHSFTEELVLLVFEGSGAQVL